MLLWLHEWSRFTPCGFRAEMSNVEQRWGGGTGVLQLMRTLREGPKEGWTTDG